MRVLALSQHYKSGSYAQIHRFTWKVEVNNIPYPPTHTVTDIILTPLTVRERLEMTWSSDYSVYQTLAVSAWTSVSSELEIRSSYDVEYWESILMIPAVNKQNTSYTYIQYMISICTGQGVRRTYLWKPNCTSRNWLFNSGIYQIYFCKNSPSQ